MRLAKQGQADYSRIRYGNKRIINLMSSTHKPRPSGHGGPRIGAGRKPAFLEQTRPVRIPLSQIAAVRTFLHGRVFPESVVLPQPVVLNDPGRVLPVYASGVRAGFPSPADDHAESGLNLNELLENPAATFCAWAEGDSMIDLGILDGDLMIIDRSLAPRNDDVVVADMNGAFTVKRLVQKPDGSFLMPANPDYPAIPITADDEIRIWGVVVRVIHDLRATGRRKRPAGNKPRKKTLADSNNR
jgi:DNA polymerase V